MALTALSYAVSWEPAPAPRSRRLPVRRVVHSLPPAVGTCGVESTIPVPSDRPVQLSCWQAKAVASQARTRLAQPPSGVRARAFAATLLDWLDPHGLWSAAPDSPARQALQHVAPTILASIQNPKDDRGCEAARAAGRTLSAWVDELRDSFDEGARSTPPPEPWPAASDTIFEDGSVHRPARDLAGDLGRRMAAIRASLGPVGSKVHDAVRLRMFPQLTPHAWGQAVLAAALRAYVLHIDAHGAWAPMDEETSLYEVELEGSGRQHLWRTMTRTAAGVRIDAGPISPLQKSDVIVSIGTIMTAGLTVEQTDQLGIVDPMDVHPARDVLVLRKGSTRPERLIVAPPPARPVEPEEAYSTVRLERVPYREGHIAVLELLDVPDDLGAELASVLAEARLEDGMEGVVLDLRGNGGGSIEGATEALAPFLPGAPLFPMRRRDGTVELEFAPVPARTDHYDGPVAALVDPATASAAEMIAGALSAYHRGVVVGTRTYGKGCAQEYLDDDAGVGVLRLSTLVYALPDGRPVQKVGLRPDIRVDFPSEVKREDTLPSAMASWRGPDIRVGSLVRPVAWPAHGGRVGPCRDAGVCRALRALGLGRGASARAH